MPSKTVNLYPCVDSLLYMPVYLAIESFSFRDSAAPLRPRLRVWDAEKQMHATVWEFGDGHVIRLYEPAKGDLDNYERFKKFRNTDDEIHVAIGDPTHAVLSDPQILGGDESRELRVLGTFVNRIALWGVSRRSYADAGKNDAIGKLRENIGSSGMPLYPEKGAFGSLHLGYCRDAHSTKLIMGQFAEAAFTSTSTAPAGIGEAEIRGTLKDYDITFTNAPWLVYGILDERQASKTFEIHPWFQSVPFPFSSLIICAGDSELKRSTQLLALWVQHLIVGLAMLYRYRRTSVTYVKSMILPLRNFGLSISKIPQGRETRIIEDAFSRLVSLDCYCESLEDAWVAWELAFEALTRNRSLSPAKATRALDRLKRSRESEALARAASNQFIQNDFPTVLRKMVESAEMESFGTA